MDTCREPGQPAVSAALVSMCIGSLAAGYEMHTSLVEKMSYADMAGSGNLCRTGTETQ